MNDETQILRIGIDGRWEASEFATSLTALDRLYTLRFALAMEQDDLRDLRELYLDAPFPPFPSSMRYLRRWAKLASPTFLQPERTPLTSATRITAVSGLLEPGERLVVQRVIYGSPGIKDLAGVGEIVGHVKDLLVRLIDHWSTRRQRKLENDRRELENQQLQVEITKQFVGLAQELGYSKHEMRQLVSAAMHEQKPLVGLIASGKITSADTVDESRP
jgi:HAMP domain-containing protein